MTDYTFIFDEEKHLYCIDEVEVPSVTGVLVEAGIVDTRWYTEWARHRGSTVHRAIELLVQGVLDWETVDPRIKGYLDAYQRFRVEKGFVPAECEKQVFSAKEQFAGTFDQLGNMDGELAIVDTKTGPLGPAVGLQLTGYAVALAEMDGTFPTALIGLQLGIDGRYRMKRYTADFATWRAALQVTRWKRKNQ